MDVLSPAVLAAIPAGCMLVNRAGQIVSANQRLLDTFGYSDQPASFGLVDLLPQQYRGHHASLVEGFWRSPQARSMGGGRDLTALHQQGHEFPVEIGLAPWPDQNPTHILVSVVDITERTQKELSLAAAVADLDQFTRVVAHDLRSPALGLCNLCQFMADDLAAGRIDDLPALIEKAAARAAKMHDLVNDLLVYSRSSYTNEQFESVHLPSLVDEIFVLLAPPDGFSIQVECEEPQWMTARVPLQTVLRNLIANAIGHHDASSGQIRISFANSRSEGRVQVADDGPGIPSAAGTRVTQLFQTLTRQNAHQSTGIGLAVCRRLIESYGGQLDVGDSSLGGALFSFAWPRVDRRDYNRI